jgi:hypothetical protein
MSSSLKAPRIFRDAFKAFSPIAEGGKGDNLVLKHLHKTTADIAAGASASNVGIAPCSAGFGCLV